MPSSAITTFLVIVDNCLVIIASLKQVKIILPVKTFFEIDFKNQLNLDNLIVGNFYCNCKNNFYGDNN